jgi:hypothetical protein
MGAEKSVGSLERERTPARRDERLDGESFTLLEPYATRKALAGSRGCARAARSRAPPSDASRLRSNSCDSVQAVRSSPEIPRMAELTRPPRALTSISSAVP